MAWVTVLGAVKFSRLVVHNLHQIQENILVRYSPPLYIFSWQRPEYSTITEKKTTDGGGTEPPLSDPSENEKKLMADVELLNKELVELKDLRVQLEDKYKRALADGENLRVRLTKQIEDAKLFGIQGFCKDLLDVADVLGKANESVPKDELTGKNPHLKTLYEGLSMTEAQLHKVFKKHGLVSLNPLDEKFDPNQHEALFQQEVEGKEPGTVVVVSKVGYKLHERVVRPALVGVAKG
ncbi:hypothetical protein KM043_006455 [Ampulex compressa]|nr:hypothetical protein KM043_006455 [Ampulex compressa]